METKLKEHYWKFITEHNPELMFSLQENYSVTSYLNEKIKCIQPKLQNWRTIGYPESSIFLLAMEILTTDLKPSRFQFISSLLKHDFPSHYTYFSDHGVLTYKTLILVELCQGAFDSIRFSEAHCNSGRFKEAISGIIRKQISLNTHKQHNLKRIHRKTCTKRIEILKTRSPLKV